MSRDAPADGCYGTASLCWAEIAVPTCGFTVCGSCTEWCYTSDRDLAGWPDGGPSPVVVVTFPSSCRLLDRSAVQVLDRATTHMFRATSGPTVLDETRDV